MLSLSFCKTKLFHLLQKTSQQKGSGAVFVFSYEGIKDSEGKDEIVALCPQ